METGNVQSFKNLTTFINTIFFYLNYLTKRRKPLDFLLLDNAIQDGVLQCQRLVVGKEDDSIHGSRKKTRFIRLLFETLG